jgi:hypothetical protein
MVVGALKLTWLIWFKFNWALAVRHRKKGGVVLQIKKQMALFGLKDCPARDF